MSPPRPHADRVRGSAPGDRSPEGDAGVIASGDHPVHPDPVDRSSRAAAADDSVATDPPSSTGRHAATAASPPRSSPNPAGGVCPLRVGGFRVARQIGQGGMGAVFEAVDDALGRRAAVKILHQHLAAKPGNRERFEREARAAAAIASDHVVTIYQVGEVDGLPYLAMEFLDGSDLETWLRARAEAVTTRDVLWVARDLLTGLAAAHARGILHRDIKPSNLWVDSRTGRLKVLDFGLTRGLDGDDTLTETGAVLGTPAYMSPQQARGERLDPRADLFSAGVVLYRMVAGRSPFARSNVPGTLLAVATEDPPPLTGVPAALAGFVRRLMAKDTDDRPADASAALAELAALEHVVPARGVSRRRWRVALGFAAVAVFLVGVILVIRDKTGKEIARVEIPDDASRAGSAEVVDTKTGARAVLPIPSGEPVPPLPPAKDALRPPAPPKTAAPPAPPAPQAAKDTPPAAPSRVRVTAETTGMATAGGGEGTFLPVGSTGTVVGNDPGGKLYRVQFDDPGLGVLWLPAKSVETVTANP